MGVIKPIQGFSLANLRNRPKPIQGFSRSVQQKELSFLSDLILKKQFQTSFESDMILKKQFQLSFISDMILEGNTTINIAPPSYDISSERPAETYVLTVGPSETYTTLDAALSAVSNDDTIIQVKNPTTSYGKPSNIDINYSVWIEPYGSDTPHFEWSSAMNTHVQIISDDVTIYGKGQMSFRNTQSSDVFKIIGSDCTIHDCEFSQDDTPPEDEDNLSACILARGNRARLINLYMHDLVGDAIYFGADFDAQTINDIFCYGNNIVDVGAAGIQFNPHELSGADEIDYVGTHTVQANRIVNAGYNQVNNKKPGIVIAARQPDNMLNDILNIVGNWVEDCKDGGIKNSSNGTCDINITSNYCTGNSYGIWANNNNGQEVVVGRDNYSWDNTIDEYNINPNAEADFDSSNLEEAPPWL